MTSRTDTKLVSKAAFALAAAVCLAAGPAFGGFLFWGRQKADPLQCAKSLFSEAKYADAAAQFEAELRAPLRAADKKLAYWFLGQCHERGGYYDRALSTYQLGVRLYPRDAQLLVALGRLYLTTGLLERAQQAFNAVLRLDAGSFEANTGLAEVYMREGFFSRAQERYKTALESMEVRDAALWRAYAGSVFRQRKYAQARVLADHALSIAPDDADSLLLSAQIYREAGLKAGALSELERAARAAPGRADIALRRALWLAAEGDTAASLAISRAALARDPDEPLALFAAGLALLKAGDADAARRELAKAAGADGAPFIAAAARGLLDAAPRGARKGR